MDHETASESPTSITTKKLNAKAPEFIPKAVVPPMQRVFAPPPSPPPFYGHEGYFQRNGAPFYGYCLNQFSPVELPANRSKSTPVAAPVSKKGLTDVHEKILNQVEFYFSDINLATTDQLFGYMINDPEGYVPLSIVASFKKIKSAINCPEQLATILRSSKKLLVSEDGTMVKRRNLLTESDMEELQLRIVIAENLPDDHSQHNLMKIFSSVGSVKSIRTCPPQKFNGASSTSKGDPTHFSSKLHAFVEFESVEDAEKAVVELADEGNWRNGLKVRLLLKNTSNPQVKHPHVKVKKVGLECQPISRKDEGTMPEMQNKSNHLDDSLLQSDSPSHERRVENNGTSNGHKKGRNHNGGGNVKGKGRGHGHGRGQVHGRGGHVNGNVLGYQSKEVSGSIEKLSLAKTSSVPRMPDGTKGFSLGRGKPVAVQIA